MNRSRRHHHHPDLDWFPRCFQVRPHRPWKTCLQNRRHRHRHQFRPRRARRWKLFPRRHQSRRRYCRLLHRCCLNLVGYLLRRRRLCYRQHHRPLHRQAPRLNHLCRLHRHLLRDLLHRLPRLTPLRYYRHYRHCVLRCRSQTQSRTRLRLRRLSRLNQNHHYRLSQLLRRTQRRLK